MKVYRGLDKIERFNNPIITIGSFDGLHLGHQQIFQKLRDLAKDNSGETVVITFDPHPRQIIYPKDKTLQLITSLEEKIELFQNFDIDHLVIVPFSIEFSQISADEYIEKFLIEKFAPHTIVIGYDHKFGLNRIGDINYLRWFEKKGVFKVEEISKHEIDAITISSTKIRKALSNKEIKKANKLLGYPFNMIGKVIVGQKIGKTLGYPTANISIESKHKLIPPYGIYAVNIFVKNVRYQGMLYIGDRPSMVNLNDRTIEVNIFNFDEDIYGVYVKIELISYIRDDIKFSDLEQLKQQLAIDKKNSQLALSEQESESKISRS